MDTQTQTPEPVAANTNNAATNKIIANKFAPAITEFWLSATGKKNYVRTVIRNEKNEIVEDFKSNLPKTVARNFLAQPAFTELESKMIDGYTVVRMPNA